MIPSNITIQNGELPDVPGVYLMKDAHETVLYVGKATSLARRVRQHFERPHNRLIEEMTTRVRAIDYIERATALEALILEANLIKQYWPKYNTDQKDGKTFLYLVITNEPYPKPLTIRGAELPDDAATKYLRVFGPYPSGRSLRAALDYLRRVFPWSTCEPGAKRACFNVHIGLCPGVCTGAISSREYKKIIRDLIRFFDGKKEIIIRAYTRSMQAASKAQRYEEAKEWRNKVFALEHIQDVAIMKREDDEHVARDASNPFFGRIEGYDISHISGSSIVASMVVFENGEANKSAYRKFKMKLVQSNNDVGSIQEVLTRRLAHAEWRLPTIFLIDGGAAQVRAAEAVMQAHGVSVPVLGIAKGRERKRNDIVAVDSGRELLPQAAPYVDLLARVRDEAHRFAITFHRKTRAQSSTSARFL